MNFGKLLLVTLVCAFMLASVPVIAEDDLPAAPSAAKTVTVSTGAASVEPSSPAVEPVKPAKTSESPSKHRFWDKTNIGLFSGVAVMRTLDYTSTLNMQARGREEILLPDEVVNNRAAFATIEAAATVTSVGISYIFHRTNHHKLERWMSICHISVAGFGAARNYALDTHHPQPQ